MTNKLTGPALLQVANFVTNHKKGAIAAGYVEENGQPNWTAYCQALLDAKAVTSSETLSAEGQEQLFETLNEKELNVFYHPMQGLTFDNEEALQGLSEAQVEFLADYLIEVFVNNFGKNKMTATIEVVDNSLDIRAEVLVWDAQKCSVPITF